MTGYCCTSSTSSPSPAAADTASAPSKKEAAAPPEAASRPDGDPEAGKPPETASGPEAVKPPETAKQRYVVAAIGDSLTDARANGGKYLNYLRERCPQSQFDNYGKGGDMTNQMRKRFVRDVMPSKTAYTHVIVFGGVNDLYSDLTAKRTPKLVGKDLTEMYQGARKRGARVVALTVAPWGGFKAYYNASRGAATLELNRWIVAQKAAGVVDHVIDTYPMLSCGDPEHLCPSVMAPSTDGLHFGPEGHLKIGKALHEQVFADCL